MPEAINLTWRSGRRTLLLLSILAALAGCKSKAGATNADGGAATADAAPRPLASNQAKIIRYKDETDVDPPTGVIQWAAENVYTAAGGTDLIVTLRRGTDVQKIARRDNFQLLVFVNPGDPTDHLMGWINDEAFRPEPVHPPPDIACKDDQVAILVAGGGQACLPSVGECKVDSDCPNEWVCDGQARKFKGGKPDKLVRFCRVGVRLPGYEAGAPPVEETTKDAGKHK
jgi:hypothetical protein